MSEEADSRSLMGRVLFWLADAVFKYPGFFFWPQFVLMALSIWYTVENLEFLTSRSDLVGGDKQYHKIYLEFKKEFPIQDDLVVVVESESMERNRQFVERLGKKLERDTNFASVFYKGDLVIMGPKALLFLPEDALRDLHKTLQDYKPFLVQFTKATNLVSLFDLINTQFRTASREENAENRALVKALPALGRIIDQATDSLKRPGVPPSPGINALFEGGAEAERQMYITYGDGRIYLLTAQARDESGNADAVKRMRELITETQLEVPGLNVGLTGEPVLEVDEMAQSQHDSTVATILSLVIVALIFIYGYHETGRPLKATGCLLVGLAYTMAFTTFAVGHLNILTITFVPILIGLAIDFGVHLITRYEEELRRGRSQKLALEKSMVNTGMGIFTGAFTTAGAFFAMAATDFKGIQEMGVICGGGLIICLVPMLTLLPVLLLKGHQNVVDHDLGDKLDRRARIENIWLQRPITTTIVTVALCLLAATQLPKTYFDYDLLNMQSRGLPAVEAEQKLINSTAKSVLYGAVIATNLQHAALLEEKLKQLPTVASIDSMTQFLNENQSRKLDLIHHIKADLKPVHFSDPDPRPVNVPELSATLYSFSGYLGAANEEVSREDPELSKRLLSMRQAVSELRRTMLARPEVSSERLAIFQRALFNDVRDTFDTLKNQDTRAALRVQDLPSSLRDRFVGITGKHLLMVYPKFDVWQRENQERFVKDLRTIDPDATGTPVQLYEYTTLLKESYEEAARYSFIAICILVLIHFRSLLSLVLALVPVGLGYLWLSGFMGYFGIPLNPANIMMLPLVIGIGVTNGIHILNRYAEEQTPSILARSTGKAVLVSGLTSIAGFGSLILAQHRGIQSLGLVMAIGLATCMIAGLTFLPALLNLMGRRK